MIRSSKYIIYLVALSILTACSTTSGLQEDEVLYTGIKKIRVEDKKNTYAESVALTEVEAALAYAPNSSFMGSSSIRFPISVGLWVYNKYVNNHKSGFSKWMFDTFSTTPVTLTMVNPETRVQVATNTLQNYGYFQGKVSYDIVPHKNPKKAKINYTIKLGEPYTFDTIVWNFPERQDSVVRATADNSYLKDEGQFSVADLQMEKERLTNEFRNQGYYFYRPDYIRYIADSMMVPQKVQLLVAQDYDTPERAQHKWCIGNISTYIRTRQGGTESRRTAFTDSTDLRGLKIVWTGDKNPISPRVMFRNFRFWRRQEFSQSKLEETLADLSNMKIFSRLQFTCTPRDTTQTCDTLDVRLDVTMDQPIEAEFDFNITQKSNSQIGPNAAIMLSKRNAFGHGETFALKLKGSYEWLTKGAQIVKGQDQINSYEAGAGVSITYPWLVFPGLSKKRFKYPTTTSFKFDFDHLNRSGYYRLLSFNAEATYTFQTSKSFIHRVTPLSLTYDRLEHTTAKFDSIASKNRALLVSLQDQFIPAMQYVITYDNNWDTHRRFNTWMEISFKEASNLISGVSTFLGKKFDKKGKKMFSSPYSQFLKLSFDLRNKYKLTDKSLLATRLYAGALWSYGNSSYAPYSELFYVGGANDIRAFAARAIGPGRYYDSQGRGTYLDQAGDFKLEANIEYRFNLVSNLHGALFIDAGNVWMLKKEDSHPLGELSSGNLLKSIALGTGFGFRYDLEFLVLRLDLGIGIHAPYDTGKKSYYNMPKFWDSLGFHFAVGYPF
ncbi:MAG: BamA/TamA family outer membrane protein [Bacteroidaceae bacterium]|nr:BamA/TamA family outer membrane protein [Bacteroidaceae bacterium]